MATTNNNVELLSTAQILGREVAVYGTFENPLFLAKDVAEWIDYTRTSKGSYDVSNMLKSLEDDEKMIRTIFVSSKTRDVWMLTENGLYETLFQSRKPIAKKFRKEVKLVLNTIRRHGMYATPEKIHEYFSRPEVLAETFKRLHEEQTLRIEAEKQVELLKPKAELMEKVLDCDEMIDVGQASKILELPYGRNRLFAQLRERGIFFKNRNEPKQVFVDKGYFVVKIKHIDRNNHDSFSVIKVLITQRGLEFLAKEFGIVSTDKKEAKCE